MKLFKKKSNSNDDFLAQEAKEEAATAADYTLDIPDDDLELSDRGASGSGYQ